MEFLLGCHFDPKCCDLYSTCMYILNLHPSSTTHTDDIMRLLLLLLNYYVNISLQEGEYLLSVNGQSVLQASHTDAARIILMGSSTAFLVTLVPKDGQ